jgi:CheY-like chemotaxis protein
MSEDRRLVVLLVEDEPDLLELAERYLGDEGMVVATARDGEQALAVAPRLKPDVVVTDLMMPGLDGFGFMRAYNRLDPKHAPVVAVSAMRGYLAEARTLGAAAVLSKPYDLEKMAEAIRDVAHGTAVPPPVESPENDDAEAHRLGTIVGLALDQPQHGGDFDGFVREVARHFDVPIALLSVITADEQIWNAACGLPPDLDEKRAGARDESFCTHAVVAKAALVVQDAAENPLFRSNRLVRERGVRFYAGVPLMTREGEAIGTLCIIDLSPHRVSHFDLEVLGMFARRVMALLELRELKAHPNVPECAFEHLHVIDRETGVFGKAAFMSLAVIETFRAIEQRRSASCALIAFPARRLGQVLTALKARPEPAVIGRFGTARLAWLVHGMSAEECKKVAHEVAGEHSFVEVAALDRCASAVAWWLRRLESMLGDAGLE